MPPMDRHIDFAAIEARHGTVDAYLETVLGVDAAMRAAIHERLLV